MVKYVITNNDDLINKLIPHFDKYTFKIFELFKY